MPYLFLLMIGLVSCAKPLAIQPSGRVPSNEGPYPEWVPGKPGFVHSLYAPESGDIDVRGYAPGTEARDPYTGNIFLVPEPPEPSPHPGS